MAADSNQNLYLAQGSSVVLAGYGKMGRLYARILKNAANVSQIIIVDTSPERRNKAIEDGFLSQNVLPSMDALKEAAPTLLAQRPILFFNVTSERAHFVVAKNILDIAKGQGSKLAYVTEKPFMGTFEEAKQIAGQVKQIGAAFGLNMICEHAEFRPKVFELIEKWRTTHDIAEITASLGTNHMGDPRDICGIETEIVHPIGIINGLFPELGDLDLYRAEVRYQRLNPKEEDEPRGFRFGTEGIWKSTRNPDLPIRIYSGFNWDQYQCPVILTLRNRKTGDIDTHIHLHYDDPGTYQDGYFVLCKDGSRERYLHADDQLDIPENLRGYGKAARMFAANLRGFNDFVRTGDADTALGPNNLKNALMLQMAIHGLVDYGDNKWGRFVVFDDSPEIVTPPLPDPRQNPSISFAKYSAQLAAANEAVQKNLGPTWRRPFGSGNEDLGCQQGTGPSPL